MLDSTQRCTWARTSPSSQREAAAPRAVRLLRLALRPLLPRLRRAVLWHCAPLHVAQGSAWPQSSRASNPASTRIRPGRSPVGVAVLYTRGHSFVRVTNSAMRGHMAGGLEYIGKCALLGISASSTPLSA